MQEAIQLKLEFIRIELLIKAKITKFKNIFLRKKKHPVNRVKISSKSVFSKILINGRLREYIRNAFLKHVSYIASNFAHSAQARLLSFLRARYFTEQQNF